MTTYSKLQLHLARHVYKRGKNKGEAPLDGSRRARDHVRVINRGDCMVVRMHYTDILRAYPDGRIMIDTNGWDASSTTRQNMNYALRNFVGFACALYSRNVMGLSQSVFLADGIEYRFYDGMEFDAAGKLLTEPRAFEMRRIDKQESDEFAAEVKASGFKDTFALLYATATPPEGGTAYGTYGNTATPSRMREKLADSDQAHYWPDIISAYKYQYVYNYKAGGREYLEKGDAKSCWAQIMKDIKKEMYVTLKSDKFTL